MTQVALAFEALLRVAEGGLRDGTMDTPARAARAWGELTSGYHVDPASVLRDFDNPGYDEMVEVGPIPFHSLCEHHLLPFFGTAHVAYVPQERVVGLSKVARLVREVYAPRLQLQERLTAEVADAMWEHLDPKGVAVVVQARHLCMEMRGVQAAGVFTRTSALRGHLLNDPAARAEALHLIGRNGTT